MNKPASVLIQPTFRRWSRRLRPEVPTASVGCHSRCWLWVRVTGEQMPSSLVLRSVRLFCNGDEYVQTFHDVSVPEPFQGRAVKAGPITVVVPKTGQSWLECQVDGGDVAVETRQLQPDGSEGRGWSSDDKLNQWRGPLAGRDGLVSRRVSLAWWQLAVAVVALLVAVVALVVAALTLWVSL